MPDAVTIFDPLLSPADADAMVRLCQDYGAYRTYAEEPPGGAFATKLPQRFDAVMNFLRTGGLTGNRDGDVTRLAARTNYFRDEYAYGENVLAPGIETFLHHEGFVEAARALHDRPVIEPAIVYANLMLPGQELAVHTDVPEFRGANRKVLPQWLMVVMAHSGLFDAWRMPIATGVAYFGPCEAGAFTYYPDGPTGPVDAIPVRHNTAVLLDTDSIFHGVDGVGAADPDAPAALPGMRLLAGGDADAGGGADSDLGRDGWRLMDDDRTVATYALDQVRFSVSWKAYTFADEAERAAWRDHTDDLTLDTILSILGDDLRRRGHDPLTDRTDREVAERLIAEYIHFPVAADAGSAA